MKQEQEHEKTESAPKDRKPRLQTESERGGGDSAGPPPRRTAVGAAGGGDRDDRKRKREPDKGVPQPHEIKLGMEVLCQIREAVPGGYAVDIKYPQPQNQLFDLLEEPAILGLQNIHPLGDMVRAKVAKIADGRITLSEDHEKEAERLRRRTRWKRLNREPDTSETEVQASDQFTILHHFPPPNDESLIVIAGACKNAAELIMQLTESEFTGVAKLYNGRTSYRATIFFLAGKLIGGTITSSDGTSCRVTNETQDMLAGKMPKSGTKALAYKAPAEWIIPIGVFIAGIQANQVEPKQATGAFHRIRQLLEKTQYTACLALREKRTCCLSLALYHEGRFTGHFVPEFQKIFDSDRIAWEILIRSRESIVDIFLPLPSVGRVSS